MRFSRALLGAVVVGVVTYAAYEAVRRFAPQGVEAFARDVRDGMQERESQLREALGMEADPEDTSGHAARHGAARSGGLTAREARDLLDDPAGLAPGGRSVPPFAPQARAEQGS